MTKSVFGPERINPGRTDSHLFDEAANDFAVQILMPKDSFLAQAKELGGNISKLAKKFGVPQDAVRRRAAMLGLKGHGMEDTSRWLHPE